MHSRLFGYHWLNRQKEVLIGHMTPHDKIIRIGVLVYPGCLRSGAVMPIDVFTIANTLASMRPVRPVHSVPPVSPVNGKPVQFEAIWVSARGDGLQEVGGLHFQTRDVAAVTLDALMIPGMDPSDAHQLDGMITALVPEQALIMD